MFVYLITNNVTGKVYIGQTHKAVALRFKEHCRGKKSLISRSIQKHGSDNFTVEEVAVCFSQSDLNDAEWAAIRLFNCIAPNGYNLKEGGGATGSLCMESRRKISAALTGKTPTASTREKLSQIFSGEGNPMFGKTHSEDTRTAISEKRRGVSTMSQEGRRRVAESNRRRRYTAETSEKRSAANSGENNPMFGRTGADNPRYGTSLSEETRKKISEALKGRKLSVETVQKREETRRRRKGKEVPS